MVVSNGVHGLKGGAVKQRAACSDLAIELAAATDMRRFLPACFRQTITQQSQSLTCAVFGDMQDENEWRDWAKVGDPVLHIELRR
jgi:hypothetical protein